MEGPRIAVIGGGTGGYSAAIRAAQLGARVTLIEKDRLGGTCLNRGCIPTKCLLHSADVLWGAKTAAAFGVGLGNVTFDYAAALKRATAVVDSLVGGVESLMRKHKIRVVRGMATVAMPGKVVVKDTGEEVCADALIIATGSESKAPPLEGVAGPGVIDSTGALSLPRLPKSAVVIGGGAIGLEFAQMWRRTGVQVTVVEMMGQLLPGEDAEVGGILSALLKEEGIQVHVNAKVKRIVPEGEASTVYFDVAGQECRASGEKVLLATGRAPHFGGLDLDRLGIGVTNGAIVVNDRMETSVPGIYAAGDVTGGFMLAHASMAGGRCAAENAAGGSSRAERRLVPRCVFTSPEAASIGLSEAQARQKYDQVKVGRFPLKANGRAMALGQTAGMVKVVAEAPHGEILGVHILGPCASELIAEAVLAMRLEATFQDLAHTIHAHPTLSEATMEAALGVAGISLHI